MRAFLAAVRFLTIVPLPGSWGTAAEDLARSVVFFPLVGLILGTLAAAAGWALAGLGVPPLLAALALVVLLMSFSGCLHLDGLSDSADGLLSSRNRQRMLEIMKDSHVGPMGLIAVLVLVLAKFSALASLPAGKLWAAAGLMPLAGRVALVVHMALLPYVRPGGLGSVFAGQGRGKAALWAGGLLLAVAWGLFRWQGLVLWGACLAVMLILAAHLRRKLGGITGDTLGAVCEIVEAVPAVLLAVWPGLLAWGGQEG